MTTALCFAAHRNHGLALRSGCISCTSVYTTHRQVSQDIDNTINGPLFIENESKNYLPANNNNFIIFIKHFHPKFSAMNNVVEVLNMLDNNQEEEKRRSRSANQDLKQNIDAIFYDVEEEDDVKPEGKGKLKESQQHDGVDHQTTVEIRDDEFQDASTSLFYKTSFKTISPLPQYCVEDNKNNTNVPQHSNNNKKESVNSFTKGTRLHSVGMSRPEEASASASERSVLLKPLAQYMDKSIHKRKLSTLDQPLIPLNVLAAFKTNEMASMIIQNENDKFLKDLLQQR